MENYAFTSVYFLKWQTFMETCSTLLTSGSSGIWMIVLKNSISLALSKNCERLQKKTQLSERHWRTMTPNNTNMDADVLCIYRNNFIKYYWQSMQNNQEQTEVKWKESPVSTLFMAWMNLRCLLITRGFFVPPRLCVPSESSETTRLIHLFLLYTKGILKLNNPFEF